jgi:hypothetical protein
MPSGPFVARAVRDRMFYEGLGVLLSKWSRRTLLAWCHTKAVRRYHSNGLVLGTFLAKFGEQPFHPLR